MPNNRIFYAVQAVKMKPCQGTTSYTYGNERVLRGVQSVGLTTNFNLEQVYQLGQLDLYSNVEEVPDVEMTMQKVLDGTRLLYNTATDGSSVGGGNNLALTQIGDRRVDVMLGIWEDTSTLGASGATSTYVVTSGAYVSSVSYNFSTDGNFTEDLTLVSNNLKWNTTPYGSISAFTTSGIFGSGANTPETRNVARRWSFGSTSVLPTGSGGIPTLGTNNLNNVHLNSVSISCNLGREAINKLGLRAPYYRYVNFPVEVTSEFEVTSLSGAQIDADDYSTTTGCSSATNLVDKSIVIDICNPNDTTVGYKFDLGTKNKLTTFNQTGGDTGGGNVTVTYSFQTFNSFKVSGVG